MKNKKNNIYYYSSIFVLISTILFTLLLAYWLFFPYKILEVNSMKLLTKEIVAGEELIVSVDFCKHYKYPVEITYQIINGFIYSFPEKKTNFPIGCKAIIQRITIPKTTYEGEYILAISYTYHPNPIRTIIYNWEIEKFKIIK